ncbi:hypothetical protein BpHYR1_015711 [Brachionus plicatilis]|uniref:Uncharacterized protein n=1 Tax=Brachionus plicatilis TaxID=10195 RepID=A0A3M7PE06_BRAPC|nr:hypothetical protein BpHYR1_015711 [Brachionus plicatilis]
MLKYKQICLIQIIIDKAFRFEASIAYPKYGLELNFLKFDRLVYLELSIENLRQFLYRNGLQEMILNKAYLTRVIQIHIVDGYEFADEDFCLIK